MCAAERAPTCAAVTMGHIAGLLLRLGLAVIATLALVLVWRPSVLRAQSPQDSAVGKPAATAAVRPHTVKPGETLWSLAARYYGDGHQWPDLARRNGIAITGTPLLRVGMQLTVPVRPAIRGTMAAEVSAIRAPATRVVAPDTSLADRLLPASPILSDRAVRRTGLVQQEDQLQARDTSDALTVFHRDLPDAAEAERRTRAVLRPNTPTPRQAEFDAAPWIVPEASLAHTGRIIARVGSPVSNGNAYPQRAIKTDQVEIEAARNQRYKVGDVLVAVVATTTFADGQRLLLPTGVIAVVKAEPGAPALGLVRRQSGRIEQGQMLVPALADRGAWVTTQKLATPDVSTTVKWLDDHEVLPTLQSFLVLAAGAAQGLKAGDEVALYRAAAKGTAEHVTATVRVVRVERDHAAAIITRQYDTDVTVGMVARRYAKVP